MSVNCHACPRILSASFAVSLAALAVVAVTFGLDRQHTFEIVMISIVWLTLAVGGQRSLDASRDRADMLQPSNVYVIRPMS